LCIAETKEEVGAHGMRGEKYSATHPGEGKGKTFISTKKGKESEPYPGGKKKKGPATHVARMGGSFEVFRERKQSLYVEKEKEEKIQCGGKNRKGGNSC